MRHYCKILLLLVVFAVPHALFAADAPNTATTQNQAQQGLPLAGTTQTNNNATATGTNTSDNKKRPNRLENIPFVPKEATFPQLVQGIFNFAIGTVAIAALFMIIIGGFWYMTSAGNQAQASNAKNIIRDALFGLIVALFAWLLLYTINHDIVEKDINHLQPPKPPSTGDNAGGTGTGGTGTGTGGTGTGTGGTGGTGTGTGGTGTGDKYRSHPGELHCKTCVSVTSDSVKGLPTKPACPGSGDGTCGCLNPPGGTCQIDKDIGEKLLAIKTDPGTKDVNFIVSELGPPTVNHLSACHSAGTCVDVSLKDENENINDDDIKKFYNAAKAKGLRPVYEVSSPDRKEKLEKKLEIPISLVNGIHGEHFSIYKK